MHTQDWFINKAKSIHGDKYIYDNVRYSGLAKLITIICKEHGEFKQLTNNHLNGHGCPKCGTYTISKKVYSPELNMNFNSETDAAKYVGISRQAINSCLKGKGKSAGKHPETGYKLTWKYI